jgi:small-conductance mechanosensitive channel
MMFLTVMHDYFLWHYSRALLELFHVWLNLLWFVVHFFSLPQLMRSWIAPWKRMVEDRGEKWNLEDLAAFVVIGIISRIIGFILRTIVITLGLVSLLVVAVGGFATYAFWLVAPAAIISLLGFGLALLFA